MTRYLKGRRPLIQEALSRLTMQDEPENDAEAEIDPGVWETNVIPLAPKARLLARL